MFTLEPEKWYALETLQPIDFAGPGDRYWPAYVSKVTPLGSGHGLLEVECDLLGDRIVLRLKVWQRKPDLLLAGFGEDNALIFRPLSWSWLNTYRSELAAKYQRQKNPLPESDLVHFLDQEYSKEASKPAFQAFHGRSILFQADYHWRARAVEVPIEVQAGNLVALWEEACRRVEFYLSKRDDRRIEVRLEIPYAEHAILTAWALRFDGYTYDELHKDQVAPFITQGIIADDPMLQLTHFFMLQRYLFKWGGDRSPVHGREWRLFRTLFLKVANYDIHLAYRHPFHYRDWLLNYEPCRSQCVDIVRRIHATIPYDDDASDEAGLPERFSPFRSHTVTIAADARAEQG